MDDARKAFVKQHDADNLGECEEKASASKQILTFYLVIRDNTGCDGKARHSESVFGKIRDDRCNFGAEQ